MPVCAAGFIYFSKFIILFYYVITAPSAGRIYEFREYFIKDLTWPPGLLTYGIRDYMEGKMADAPLQGCVKRAMIQDTREQVVILAITALPTTLDALEGPGGLLCCEHFTWTTRHREPGRALTHFGFKIIPSEAGADCG